MAASLTPRERRRLLLAHEHGYLDATCRDNRAVVRAYGLWCWRLKVPMVWFERYSPRSRFGRLRLDLLTTPHTLTSAGQTALKALAADQVSPHEGLWENIPLWRLEKLAHGVFRAAVQAQNYRTNRAPVSKIRVPLKLVPRRLASA